MSSNNNGSSHRHSPRDLSPNPEHGTFSTARSSGYTTSPHLSPHPSPNPEAGGFGGRGGGYNEPSPRPDRPHTPSKHHSAHPSPHPSPRPSPHPSPRLSPRHSPREPSPNADAGGFSGRGGGYNRSPRETTPTFAGTRSGREASPGMRDGGGFGGRGGGYNASGEGSPHNPGSRGVSPAPAPRQGRGTVVQERHHDREHSQKRESEHPQHRAGMTEHRRQHSGHREVLADGGFGGRGGGYNASPRGPSPAGR